jgi:glucose-1-phosphate thymidylyltransferase
VFGYWVNDPNATAWPSSTAGKVIDLEEKAGEAAFELRGHRPVFLRRQCQRHAAELKPSPRGELEITDLNRATSRRRPALEALGRGYAWLDTGTHESLLEASNFIETIQTRQGLQVCPEEIAFGNGWIDAEQLERWRAAGQERLRPVPAQTGKTRCGAMK